MCNTIATKDWFGGKRIWIDRKAGELNAGAREGRKPTDKRHVYHGCTKEGREEGKLFGKIRMLQNLLRLPLST